MTTENRPTNSLHGQTGRVVAHGTMPHPALGESGFMAMFVVRTPDQWVICMSEGAMPYDWEKAREGLGTELRGEQFAPFAQRGVPAAGRGAVPPDQVRRIVEKSFPQVKFEWLEEEEEDE